MEAFLNGKLIGIAYANQSEKRFTLNKIVEFDFEDGDVLELREIGSIILFNTFNVINCGLGRNHANPAPAVQKAPEYGIMLGKLVPLKSSP